MGHYSNAVDMSVHTVCLIVFAVKGIVYISMGPRVHCECHYCFLFREKPGYLAAVSQTVLLNDKPCSLSPQMIEQHVRVCVRRGGATVCVYVDFLKNTVNAQYKNMWVHNLIIISIISGVQVNMFPSFLCVCVCSPQCMFDCLIGSLQCTFQPAI